MQVRAETTGLIGDKHVPACKRHSRSSMPAASKVWSADTGIHMMMPARSTGVAT